MRQQDYFTLPGNGACAAQSVGVFAPGLFYIIIKPSSSKKPNCHYPNPSEPSN